MEIVFLDNRSYSKATPNSRLLKKTKVKVGYGSITTLNVNTLVFVKLYKQTKLH